MASASATEAAPGSSPWSTTPRFRPWLSRGVCCPAGFSPGRSRRWRRACGNNSSLPAAPSAPAGGVGQSRSDAPAQTSCPGIASCYPAEAAALIFFLLLPHRNRQAQRQTALGLTVFLSVCPHFSQKFAPAAQGTLQPTSWQAVSGQFSILPVRKAPLKSPGGCGVQAPGPPMPPHLAQIRT